MELSIIVPIYNVEKYLRECLESLYKIKNIKKEIILVNDGSPDNSHLIMEEYKEKYPEETVIVNKKNGGLSSARNAGIEIAKGKYLSFIDSDDFIDYEMFEKFYRDGTSNEPDVIVGNMRYYIEGESGNPLFRSEEIKKSKNITGLKFLDLLFSEPKCFREEVVDDLYKREFIIRNKLYFKEGLLHEDSLFTPLVYINAENIKYLDYPFYFYRQRVGGIMSEVSQKSIDSLEQICFILKNEYDKIEGNVGKKSLSKLILSFYKVVVYREYDKRGNYKEKYRNYKKLFLELNGFQNKVYNESLLYISLNLSIIARKLLNKEITNKQKIPKIK